MLLASMTSRPSEPVAVTADDARVGLLTRGQAGRQQAARGAHETGLPRGWPPTPHWCAGTGSTTTQVLGPGVLAEDLAGETRNLIARTPPRTISYTSTAAAASAAAPTQLFCLPASLQGLLEPSCPESGHGLQVCRRHAHPPRAVVEEREQLVTGPELDPGLDAILSRHDSEAFLSAAHPTARSARPLRYRQPPARPPGQVNGQATLPGAGEVDNDDTWPAGR